VARTQRVPAQLLPMQAPVVVLLVAVLLLPALLLQGAVASALGHAAGGDHARILVVAAALLGDAALALGFGDPRASMRDATIVPLLADAAAVALLPVHPGPLPLAVRACLAACRASQSTAFTQFRRPALHLCVLALARAFARGAVVLRHGLLLVRAAGGRPALPDGAAVSGGLAWLRGMGRRLRCGLAIAP